MLRYHALYLSHSYLPRWYPHPNSGRLLSNWSYFYFTILWKWVTLCWMDKRKFDVSMERRLCDISENTVPVLYWGAGEDHKWYKPKGIGEEIWTETLLLFSYTLTYLVTLVIGFCHFLSQQDSSIQHWSFVVVLYPITRFLICIPHQIYLGWSNRPWQNWRACGTYEREEKCVEHFYGEIRRKACKYYM